MTTIRWRWYIRRKTPPQPWTDARRAAALLSVQRPYLPAEYGGTFYAASREDALSVAKTACHDPKATVDVVAEACWQTMTALERHVFLGTFDPPKVHDDVVIANHVRTSKCRVCGGTIRQRLDPAKRRHGRPQVYCEGCVPEKVRRWRRYSAERRTPS